ncbi:hypothetical protein [Polaromonas sp. AET17H-212]|uniref:hypothetical protein n=1 Tax=Polaromonas sp. AET17H-212 TaxID=1977061 RepID=UPI001141FABB|nr:hypothetical protein [Polaromonas sp. AET17H-212]
MNTPILVLVFALVWCGRAAATCNCEPDSLAFQDAFFKYCDWARAAYEAESQAQAQGQDQALRAQDDSGQTVAPQSATVPPPVTPESVSARDPTPQ